MVITPNYDLDSKPHSDNFYVHSHETPICPDCSIRLRPFGLRKRKLYFENASEISLVIRRLRCPCCHHIHHELPDLVIPYKRYEAKVIESILCYDSKTREEDSMPTDTQTTGHATPPDYPCESSTALRLRIWFLQILFNLNENRTILEAVRIVLNIPKLSLEILKEIPQGWLKKLFRIIIKYPHFRGNRKTCAEKAKNIA